MHACSSTHAEAGKTPGRVTAQEIEAASRLLFKVRRIVEYDRHIYLQAYLLAGRYNCVGKRRSLIAFTAASVS